MNNYWEDFAKALNENFLYISKELHKLAILAVLYPKEFEEAVNMYNKKQEERYKEYLERNSRWMQ